MTVLMLTVFAAKIKAPENTRACLKGRYMQQCWQSICQCRMPCRAAFSLSPVLSCGGNKPYFPSLLWSAEDRLKRVSSSPRKGGMKDGSQDRKQNDTLYAQVWGRHLWNLQPQATSC